MLIVKASLSLSIPGPSMWHTDGTKKKVVLFMLFVCCFFSLFFHDKVRAR